MLTRDQFAVGTNLLFHAFHKRLRKKIQYVADIYYTTFSYYLSHS